MLLAGASEVFRRVFRDAEAGRNEISCIGRAEGWWICIARQTVRRILRILSGNFYEFLTHEHAVYHQGYSDEYW